MWMEQRNTLPDIQATIIQSLNNWLLHLPPLCTTSPFLDIQNNIGWDHFVEGFLPVQWLDAQQQHYLSLNRLESGKRWATELILKLWNVAWDLWEHRNNITHASLQKAKATRITEEIAALLARGPPTNELHHLFSTDEQLKLTTATEAYKKAWITTVLAFENHRKRKDRSTLTQMQQLL